LTVCSRSVHSLDCDFADLYKMTAGYSGTPLSKKLGIKEGFKISLINEPVHYWKLFSNLPVNIKLVKGKTKANLVHYFVTEEKQLQKEITSLKENIEQNGMIWISWPKKSSKMQTDITEDVIRNIALKNGLVDVKVCAVDETWSGLKLVIPVKDRK
jgi:CMP-N-acetylneuraminic acid synthetase